MVIAVRTQSSKKTAGFQCTGNEVESLRCHILGSCDVFVCDSPSLTPVMSQDLSLPLSWSLFMVFYQLSHFSSVLQHHRINHCIAIYVCCASIAKNESQLDLLWATGFTPFSYLSSSQEISFAVREAALRGRYLYEVCVST